MLVTDLVIVVVMAVTNVEAPRENTRARKNPALTFEATLPVNPRQNALEPLPPRQSCAVPEPVSMSDIFDSFCDGYDFS